MKIVEISSVLLQPMPWVLVKVKTDEGIVGIGEAYHGAGVHQIAVDERLTKTLIGKNPLDVDRCFRDMMKGMSASGYYQGAVMSAISGIEMALWDIAGQAVGVPIWQLLGGRFRDKVRVYNDCHAGEDESPAAYAAKAKEVEARGFTAIKFDIDPLPSRRDAYNRCISNDDIAHYVEVVTAVREALDSNTDLAIDAHWAYAPVDILKVAHAFEDLGLLWLEDPIPAENVEAMAMVKNSTKTPICTGENFYTRFGFRELIQSQAADIVSPDMAKAGGLGGAADRRFRRYVLYAFGAAQYLRADRHFCDDACLCGSAQFSRVGISSLGQCALVGFGKRRAVDRRWAYCDRGEAWFGSDAGRGGGEGSGEGGFGIFFLKRQ